MTSAARHDRFEVRSRRRHLVPDEEVREDVGHLLEANETKDKHNAEEELNQGPQKFRIFQKNSYSLNYSNYLNFWNDSNVWNFSSN